MCSSGVFDVLEGDEDGEVDLTELAELYILRSGQLTLFESGVLCAYNKWDTLGSKGGENNCKYSGSHHYHV